MRLANSVRGAPFTPAPIEKRDDAVTILGEIVAQLAERVELLETRDRIRGAAFVRLKAGTLQARE